MFIRLFVLISLVLSFSNSSFALSGFLKEGGGYGVKPIKELIKESEDGKHSSIDLDRWLEQRSEQYEISDLLLRYRQAIKVKKSIISLYRNRRENERKFLRKNIIFIQGLLIVNLESVDQLFLLNKVVINRDALRELSNVAQKVLGVQIEDHYLIVDLLRPHNVKSIITNIYDCPEFVLWIE